MQCKSLIRRVRALSSTQIAYGIFFGTALLSWQVMSEMELFERFYLFSRNHEDWDVDELSLLFVNLAIALILASLYQARKQRHLIRCVRHEHGRAEHFAYRDALTGLLNRRALTRIMQDTAAGLTQSGPRYVAMLDLDRFKPINDLRGHAVGDATLQGVAQRLGELLSPRCHLARLGGDEFAIVFRAGMTDTDVEQAARSILRTFEEGFRFDGIVVHVSASIGLARWTAGLSASEALARADKALYNAKADGRARFSWYDAELDRRSTRRARIESDLRAAIHNERIEPWFQPIVEIESGRVTGFEVLARWHHADLGPVPPTEFISVAEDSNQISALGTSLLRRAVRESKSWGDHLTLSFNISPLQFQDPMLVDTMARTLRETGFAAERLTVEVTESSVIRDLDGARKTLDALKALGIKVALDDFGTGYSSLASLRQLPFDRIKIDRGFVTDICNQPQNQKIVSGIMALANGLELEVTAEGIESRHDLRFLRSLRCRLGQGFLFDRALPPSHVAPFLKAQMPADVLPFCPTPEPLTAVRT